MDLFSCTDDTLYKEQQPLAMRMRPRNFSEFFGQRTVAGEGSFLRTLVENDTIPSMIIWGAPGTGKTTLANIIALQTKSIFSPLNAVSSGVAGIKEIIHEAAEQRKFYQKRTIVFIDEIHRFNKSQQDILLPYVENGEVILIGATTENPYFEVNQALLSRVRIVHLQKLGELDLLAILKQALSDVERGLGREQITCANDELQIIAQFADGDARIALNILEQAAVFARMRTGVITRGILREILGDKIQHYDKNKEQHYDIASAFIKSMRGSDPDAALHYLARMLVAGEDVKFIARRIIICAAEDIGNADPQALVIAEAAARAVHFVGMPEARIILAQAAVYIATAPKSNACYLGIERAVEDVKKKNCGEVPLYLRDAHYKGAAKLGYGVDYKYPHDYPNHYVRQQYLPLEVKNERYYIPTDNGQEERIKKYLAGLEK